MTFATGRVPHSGPQQVVMTSSRRSSWLSDRTNISYVSRTGRQVFFFLPLAPLRASLVAQLVKNLPVCRRPGFNPWVGKIPWRREWLPTPVFWPGELHGLYSRKESDTTEWLSLTHSTWKPINTGHRAKIKTWIFTLYMMAGHIFVQHYYWMLKFSPVWHRANRLRTILTIIVITAIDFLEWREQQRKN